MEAAEALQDAPAEPLEGRCNARKRRGGLCRRPAGAGTLHVGRGPCKLHGGKMPNVQRRYARQEAIAFAREQLTIEHDVDPLEVALANVRFGYGLVAFHRLKLEALDEINAADVEELDRALLTSQRLTDVALRAGVAERLVKVAERAADQIVLVCEAGIAALIESGAALTQQQRTAYANAVRAALARLEADAVEGSKPLALPPGPAEG